MNDLNQAQRQCEYVLNGKRYKAIVLNRGKALTDLVDLHGETLSVLNKNVYLVQDPKLKTIKKPVVKIKPKCIYFTKCGQRTNHKSGACSKCRLQKCQHPGCNKMFLPLRPSKFCDPHRKARMWHVRRFEYAF